MEEEYAGPACAREKGSEVYGANRTQSHPQSPELRSHVETRGGRRNRRIRTQSPEVRNSQAWEQRGRAGRGPGSQTDHSGQQHQEVDEVHLLRNQAELGLHQKGNGRLQ